jgi:hypothetical protein
MLRQIFLLVSNLPLGYNTTVNSTFTKHGNKEAR